MMNPKVLFDILYALAALNGRGEELFGSCLSGAREAFARSLAYSTFPEVWFEVPLTGEPCFDLHAGFFHEAADPEKAYQPEETGGFPEAFSWFARQKNGARQMILSWDLRQGGVSVPAIMLLVDDTDPKTVDGFLRSVGREDAAERYRAFTGRLPEGWFPCYSGVFPGRPGSGLRVECIPDKWLQSAYAKDPELLRKHLAQAGIRNFGDTLILYCRQLADTPFQIEFQFDVEADGTTGPVLGVSLRFSNPPGEENWHCFDPNGEAGKLMNRITEWGLADSRWKQLADTAFAQRVSFKGESCLLFCYPAFVKLRWRDGVTVDAKAYLRAGTQD